MTSARFIKQVPVIVMLLAVTLTLGALSRANASILVTFDEVSAGVLPPGTNINGSTFNTLGAGQISIVSNLGNLDGNSLIVGSSLGVEVVFDSNWETVTLDVFSNSTPITLEAFDASGALLGTSVLDAGLVGTRQTLSFGSDLPNISSVIIHDSGFQFEFDNLIMNPEPSAIAVWATLIGGCALVLTRRRTKK